MSTVVKVTINKEAEYDHIELGAGYRADGTPDPSRWSLGTISETELSYDNFQKNLTDHLSSLGLEIDMFVIFEDGRLTGNLVEDIDCNELTHEQQLECHERKKQLYLCDYNIYMEIHEVVEPTVDDLQLLLPDMKQY